VRGGANDQAVAEVDLRRSPLEPRELAVRRHLQKLHPPGRRPERSAMRVVERLVLLGVEGHQHHAQPWDVVVVIDHADLDTFRRVRGHGLLPREFAHQHVPHAARVELRQHAT
jgi:hypothetical protein